MRSAVMFSRASDEWATPKNVFDALNDEFSFTLDAAARPENAKCPHFFGPGGAAADALGVADWGNPWGEDGLWTRMCAFVNPPYSRVREFMSKASWEARQHGHTVVCLVPARTDTRWWHEHVWDAEKDAPRPGVEVRFIKGRLKFGGSKNSAPFPSVVVVFRPVQG